MKTLQPVKRFKIFEFFSFEIKVFRVSESKHWNPRFHPDVFIKEVNSSESLINFNLFRC